MTMLAGSAPAIVEPFMMPKGPEHCCSRRSVLSSTIVDAAKNNEFTAINSEFHELRTQLAVKRLASDFLSERMTLEF
jgi:hypothetical protein